MKPILLEAEDLDALDARVEESLLELDAQRLFTYNFPGASTVAIFEIPKKGTIIYTQTGDSRGLRVDYPYMGKTFVVEYPAHIVLSGFDQRSADFIDVHSLLLANLREHILDPVQYIETQYIVQLRESAS